MKNLESWAKNFNNNLIATFITILILTIIGVIIYILVPENLDINYIQNTFAYKLSFFVDERAERLTYILDTILFIPVFCLIFAGTKKYIKIKNNIKFLNNFSALTTILLIVFLFVYIPFIFHFCLGMNISFIKSNSILILLLLLFSGMCYYFKDTANRYIHTTLIAILILYVIRTLFFFPTDIIDQSFMESYHYEFFVYPIFKLEQGVLPGIDFKNIYGYYPYFYLLCSYLIGALNTFKITAITSCLLLVTWFCGIFYIYKVTKSKLFAFLLSIVFVYLTGGNWSYYLQFAPLRIITFAVLLLLAVLYTQKQKKYLIFLGFTVSSLAIVWNFETGLVNLIAWTAFLSYNELKNYSIKDKYFYFSAVKYIVYAFISFTFALLIFKFLPYILFGKIANLGNILFSQSLYLKTGFMVSKINLLHPWFLPLIIYITALILVLQPLLKCEKNKDKNLPLLLFLSIFGIGIYTYYQGRSFLENLIAVLFPAVLILPVIIQKISDFSNIKTENIKNLFYTLHFIVFEFITFGALILIYLTFILNVPKLNHLKKEIPLQEKSQYLAELIQNKEPLIFTLYSSYYYKALNKKDNFPQPAAVDCYLKKDYDNLFSYLDRTHTPLVLDEEQFTRLKLFYTDKFKIFINKTKHSKLDEFILFEFKD